MRVENAEWATGNRQWRLGLHKPKVAASLFIEQEGRLPVLQR
jgi:hypothetical protein